MAPGGIRTLDFDLWISRPVLCIINTFLLRQQKIFPDFLPSVRALTIKNSTTSVSFEVGANGGLYSGTDFKATGKLTTTVAPTTNSVEAISGAHSFYSPPRMRAVAAACKHRRTSFLNFAYLIAYTRKSTRTVQYTYTVYCTQNEYNTIFLIACSSSMDLRQNSSCP